MNKPSINLDSPIARAAMQARAPLRAPASTTVPAASPAPAAHSAPPAPPRARQGWTAPFARGSRRRWQYVFGAALVLPTLLIASAHVLGKVSDGDGYQVSVPVTLRPSDPTLWSMVNARDFAAARAFDPALPDPTSVPALGEAPLLNPPATLPTRLEAYTGPAARSYVWRGATPTDTARAHYCLTAALYYEAASETDDGMRGVAQVVLNRARHPSFPGSVCGVVFQGSQRAIVCQFTFACDGSMARRPSADQWRRASRISAEALAGRVFAPVGLATHYHTLAVWPSWGRSLAMTNVIGAHIFHRWRGRYGTPAAFLRPYSGREPAPGPYLPIASQLAARRGVAVPNAALPTSDPAGAASIDRGALAAIEAARASSVAPGATGIAAAPGIGVAVGAAPPSPRANPAAPSGAAASGSELADPRLAGSGTVREEYRNSGTAIAPR